MLNLVCGLALAHPDRPQGSRRKTGCPRHSYHSGVGSRHVGRRRDRDRDPAKLPEPDSGSHQGLCRVRVRRGEERANVSPLRLAFGENIPAVVIEAVRSADCDVVWAAESLSGASDRTIVEFAKRERRIIITQDKDFADLAAHGEFPPEGLVLLRVPPRPDQIATALLEALDREPPRGMLVVIESDRIRVRKLENLAQRSPGT